MKSPTELATRLASQWRRPALRLARLTSASAWPLRLPIGRPLPARIERDPEIVRAHIHAWNTVSTGEVEWEDARYRSTVQPVRIPVFWKIARPAQWAEACADRLVTAEYASMARLCAATPEVFHQIWIGKTHLWQGKSEEVLRQAAQVAIALSPGCAEGRPLRSLPIAGVDSKFYENHRTLLLAMLDIRFDGEASTVGLEAFLGADLEDSHWVLLADLAGGLLSFALQRVNTRELATTRELPGTHLLVVENERCLHQLPVRMPGTLAILGPGLDLGWLRNPALDGKVLAYWGDLDTWGLRMLGLARAARPELTALLMDAETFDSYAPGKAVKEIQPAELPPDRTLSANEQKLFERLKYLDRGRLEQEFLPTELAKVVIGEWYSEEEKSVPPTQ